MPSWRASPNDKRSYAPFNVASFIAIVLALVLPACTDEPVVQSKKTVMETPPGTGLQRQWLELNSSIKPAQWVLDWRKPKERSASDEEMQRVQKHLTAAHNIYRESERMIANRAVQLEQMLAKLNVEESAANILEDISAVAGEIGQTEGFGAVSQHYYILRSGEYDRGAALALLKRRYGIRTVGSPGD
ncbi:hypothetical protein [Hyphomicrobium sp. LHD-15]|uniref:hypothetical protein n=1 Tax=Hyphomicrobium sp. LHD-15 TaxID=3072142 RepID=UPI00280D34D2|nr:hypothetical protein [Hyphomicrobium sp. LHD-15]MDQ8698890.1 hypothetical protein [Hyphomicrobium sp. LHD-15]